MFNARNFFGAGLKRVFALFGGLNFESFSLKVSVEVDHIMAPVSSA